MTDISPSGPAGRVHVRGVGEEPGAGHQAAARRTPHLGGGYRPRPGTYKALTKYLLTFLTPARSRNFGQYELKKKKISRILHLEQLPLRNANFLAQCKIFCMRN